MSSITKGINHIGLTVSNLEETADFFIKHLGWTLVKKRDDYPAIFIRNNYLMITLWKVKSENPVKFDRKINVGLHHLAFELDSEIKLNQLYKKLKHNNIEIEIAPTIVGFGPAKHFFCIEPSGIRIEFYWSGLSLFF